MERADSLLTASSAQVGALATRSASSTCSQPRPIGAISVEARLWKSEESGATAVTFIEGSERTRFCTVNVPSVLANVRSSLRQNRFDVTKRVPFTLSASALQR